MRAAGAVVPARGGPAGNLYDKQGTRNPVASRLIRRFEAQLDELVALAGPSSILDIGCGEGIQAERWHRRPEVGRVVGLDIEDPGLRDRWSRLSAPGLSFEAGRAEALGFGDGEFELVAAVESLEHMADPAVALREMRRVAAGHLLVSVPREPLWRALNLLRGAHVGSLGDTPGHLHHFSRSELVSLLAGFGDLVAVRSPLPWTIALVRA